MRVLGFVEDKGDNTDNWHSILIDMSKNKLSVDVSLSDNWTVTQCWCYISESLYRWEKLSTDPSLPNLSATGWAARQQEEAEEERIVSLCGKISLHTEHDFCKVGLGILGLWMDELAGMTATARKGEQLGILNNSSFVNCVNTIKLKSQWTRLFAQTLLFHQLLCLL